MEAVSDYLDIPATYEIVDLSDMVSDGGVIPEDLYDPGGKSFVPDALKEADVFVHGIAPLDWREKFLDFIPVLPTRMIVLTRKGEEIFQLGDLSGKTGLVYRHSSFDAELQFLKDKLGLDIAIRRLSDSDDDIALLIDGDGDFCVRTSAVLLETFEDYGQAVVSMNLGTFEHAGWAVRDGDSELQGILAKALDGLVRNGVFQDVFQESYDISYDNYLALINWNDGDSLHLSDQERERLVQLRDAGGLRAAVYNEQSIYQVLPDGSIEGLHYNLLLAVADRLDLPLSIQPVSFNQFFAKDGVVDERLKTDPEFSYRPDLFDDADIFVVSMTKLTWREKFFRFIDTYPTRMVYVLDGNRPRPDPENMDGMTIAIMGNSSYETWARGNLPLDRMNVLTLPSGQPETRLVAEGDADFTILDANIAFTRLKEYPELTFYPAADYIDQLGWTVSIDDEHLAGIFDKAIGVLKAEQTFDTIWREFYGISFEEYLRLLSLEV